MLKELKGTCYVAACERDALELPEQSNTAPLIFPG